MSCKDFNIKPQCVYCNNASNPLAMLVKTCRIEQHKELLDNNNVSAKEMAKYFRFLENSEPNGMLYISAAIKHYHSKYEKLLVLM